MRHQILNFITCLGLFISPFQNYAQQIELLPGTNVDSLLKLSTELKKIEDEDRERAVKWAQENNEELRVEDTDGKVIELVGITSKGEFLYYGTNNLNAAKSTSTDKVWTGGILNYNLDGQNMIVGMWDGGRTRITHQEFSNRAIQMDGANSLSSHATHVGGTMVAAGVDASAKGMAHQATLHAYDWSNDGSEMAAAAANGLLVSNHSYGSITGWYYNSSNATWRWYGDLSISTVEDYRFGFYDGRAQTWDNISYNAPYYLIVKSAGNDRNDNHTGSHQVRIGGSWTNSTDYRDPDGDYHCISSYGNAKNILSVGAVNDIRNGWQQPSDVSMSSFSSWGPTDDGRIKPDVVGNGVSLYSSDSGNDADYGTKSGTSMSGPNVSGSMILLQQKYMQDNGAYMRSATLKGLVIHTADQAANEGPDYAFGWGMMNTAKAAQLIDNQEQNQIAEHTLQNGSSYTQQVRASGIEPLRVTISWTDFPGTPPAASLNPTTLMLVNDLDIRIEDLTTNQVYEPYILDPANRSAPATTGDNFRDNVEQVFIANPTNSDYLISITHKGNLINSQDFSIIISGLDGNPMANFVADSNIKCVGSEITFQDLSTGQPATFLWSFPGGVPSSSNLQNPTVVYNSSGLYNVSLTITRPGFPLSSITKNDYVQITSPQQVEILDTVFCFPDNTIQGIRASVSGGVWDGTPWMNFTDSARFTPTFVGPGTYPLTYTLIDNAGCMSQTSSNVRIVETPAVSFNLIDNILCDFDSLVNLTGGQPLGGNYMVGNQSFNSFNPSVIGPGLFSVDYLYEDEWGCGGSANQALTIVECAVAPFVNNERMLNSISVYPNPVTNILTINKGGNQLVEVSILDILGKVVANTLADSNPILNIDLSSQRQGVYFLKLQNENDIRIVRVVKN